VESVSEYELRDKVAKSMRFLEKEGHAEYIWGHVSARVPGAETCWIKPRSLGFDEIRGDDVVLIDLDCKKIGGSDKYGPV